MALNYRELAFKEADLMNELHYIDSLLPDQHREYQQQYPQLFQDQDSLFNPDCVFNGSLGKKQQRFISQQNTYQDKNDEIFEEYLDTLEINQFINMHKKSNPCDKNGRIHQCHSKQINSLECTFKPSILKKSNKMAQNLKPSFQRLTNQKTNNKKNPYKPQSKQLKKQYSRERMENLSRPRALKTQPNCDNEDFPPTQLSSNSIKKSMHTRNSLDIAARNALWQEQKRIKIEKLRQQEQQNRQKKEASSFTPKINDYKGQRQANLSEFAKQGMANYFERLNQASRNKNLVNNTSKKNFNNKSTTSDNSAYTSRANGAKNKLTPNKKQNYLRSQNQKENKYAYQNNKKTSTRVKYQEAVQQLHRKIMSMDL